MTSIADPFNGHIDEFGIAHVQRSAGWIEATWNNISDPGAFAAAAAEDKKAANRHRRSRTGYQHPGLMAGLEFPHRAAR